MNAISRPSEQRCGRAAYEQRPAWAFRGLPRLLLQKGTAAGSVVSACLERLIQILEAYALPAG